METLNAKQYSTPKSFDPSYQTLGNDGNYDYPINTHQFCLRDDFPRDFMFGAGTAAFQVEGAVNEDGRGPSIWDTFCEKKKMVGWQTCADHYHKYKEDVKLMKEMNIDVYRFSISWSRILPTGRRCTCEWDWDEEGRHQMCGKDEGVNEKGIRFYQDLIDDLKNNGIEPFVTLHHFDTPQALEDKYNGFLDPQIVYDFRVYADLCFERFGNKVKHWCTFNEPWTFCYYGYGLGTSAPGRCTVTEAADLQTLLNAIAIPKGGRHPIAINHPKTNSSGNSGTEPYIVGHHMLIAHAHAVNLYRNMYKKQKGQIGLTNCVNWAIPKSDSTSDHSAAERSLDFMCGWFFEPLKFGRYPDSMQALLGSRLPHFTEYESNMLKGSFDFLGVNYYTANYVEDSPKVGNEIPNCTTDACAKLTYERDGIPLGALGGGGWIYVYPKGLTDLLLYIKKKYNDPVMIITENGVDVKNDVTLPLWEAVFDHTRMYYLHYHLCAIRKAIKDFDVKVKGYITWAFLDNLEWSSGFKVRFGNIYVDYNDGCKRYPKLSFEWFKLALQDDAVPEPKRGGGGGGGLKALCAAGGGGGGEAEQTPPPAGRESKRLRAV